MSLLSNIRFLWQRFLKYRTLYSWTVSKWGRIDRYCRKPAIAIKLETTLQHQPGWAAGHGRVKVGSLRAREGGAGRAEVGHTSPRLLNIFCSVSNIVGFLLNILIASSSPAWCISSVSSTTSPYTTGACLSEIRFWRDGGCLCFVLCCVNIFF